MSLFKKSNYRSANSACERIANQIERALQEMGLEVETDYSGASASRYVSVIIRILDEDDWEEIETIDIRVSDHYTRNGRKDFEVACDDRALEEGVGDHWTWPIIAIAQQTGREAPARIHRLAKKTGAVEAAAEAAEERSRIDAFRRREFERQWPRKAA